MPPRNWANRTKSRSKSKTFLASSKMCLAIWFIEIKHWLINARQKSGWWQLKKETMHCNLQIEIFGMAFSTHTHTQKGGNLVRNQNCHHIKNNVRATNTHAYSNSQVVMCAWACANIAFELFLPFFNFFGAKLMALNYFPLAFLSTNGSLLDAIAHICHVFSALISNGSDILSLSLYQCSY